MICFVHWLPNFEMNYHEEKYKCRGNTGYSTDVKKRSFTPVVYLLIRYVNGSRDTCQE